MKLTLNQEAGLKIAISRYKAGEKYTVIAGYAGSGKSTLINFIVKELDIDSDKIAYCAYTGKAAQVLINKGCPNAVTAHKLLYKTIPMSDGTFMRIKKTELEYKIVIVDECSMLPMDMVKLLLSYNDVYTIFCGDPGQLPPISKEDDNHLLEHPHIFLDEIMRQAQDSGIIRLSMMIRNGEDISNFKSDEALVLPKKELSSGMLEWANIVLCATNQTRISINSKIRELKGYTKTIEEGESLICLKNEWNTLSYNGAFLTNGVIGTLNENYQTKLIYPPYFKIPNNKLDIISGNLISDTWEDFGRLTIDKNCILTGVPSLNARQYFQISKSKKYHCPVYQFTYAYAITTWKAQGSEFEKVLGIEEKFPFDKEEHKKFLYTMVTRASSKLVLIKND